MSGMHRDRLKKGKLSFQRRVQLLAAAVVNGYAIGFAKGKIFTGGTKAVCVPVLNCYSCPGALGACPIGSLQAALGGSSRRFPFYVLGLLMLFGVALGRLICGLLCPFGLVQDLLHKIPVSRKWKRLPFHKILKYGKYVTLVLLVGVGSLFLFGGFAKIPAFCKYLCPSGTLLGALPLLGRNELLRSQIGGLFYWKLGVLLFLLILSVKVYRPFCQYLCPLGAIYGWFNRFSLVQIRWEKEKCISCGACERACPVALDVQEISVSPECIRCGKCVGACPTKCLQFSGFKAGSVVFGKKET